MSLQPSVPQPVPAATARVALAAFANGSPYLTLRDRQSAEARRARCTRAVHQPRRLTLRPEVEYRAPLQNGLTI